MATLRVGDIVTRRSHAEDLLFKIVALSQDTALLRGISLRIMSDAPLDDLVPSADLPRKLEDIYSSKGGRPCGEAEKIRKNKKQP